MVPVAGAVPQRLIEDNRRRDFHIAVALVHLAPVIDQRIAQHHALRQEEREARSLLCEHKQAEVSAKLAVVALLCLLNHREVFVQRTLLRERNAVNALEHLVLRIAAPVGAGNRREPHSFNGAGAQQMRAGAQVGKIALRVKGDLFAFTGVLLDQLLLVRLAGHLFRSLRRREREALERDVLLDDLLHFGFDLLKILAGNRGFKIKIVVETVVDCGADRKFRARIQAANRLRQNVRRGVPVSLLPFRIVEREDFHRTVLRKRRAQVAHRAVYLRGTCGLIQAHADALCDFRHGNAALKFLFTTL